MRIHIQMNMHVLSFLKVNHHYYTYTCKEVDENFITPQSSSFIPEKTPSTLHFHYIQEVDMDNVSSDDYLYLLKEHLDNKYKKIEPKLENKDVFNAIDEIVKECLNYLNRPALGM